MDNVDDKYKTQYIRLSDAYNNGTIDEKRIYFRVKKEVGYQGNVDILKEAIRYCLTSSFSFNYSIEENLRLYLYPAINLILLQKYGNNKKVIPLPKLKNHKPDSRNISNVVVLNYNTVLVEDYSDMNIKDFLIMPNLDDEWSYPYEESCL